MPRAEKSTSAIRSERKARANEVCDCGHKHNEHENIKGRDQRGNATIFLGAGPCALQGCRCSSFGLAPLPPRAPRLVKQKPLDSDEPKLFELTK